METPDVPTPDLPTPDPVFEQRVRTMLSERARDVTPDPATWQVVERRTRRRGTGRSLALAGVAAALVACALVVVPALSRGPEIRFEAGAPPSAPAADQPAVRQAVPPERREGGGEGDAPATLAEPQPAVPSAALVLTDGSSVLRTDGAGGVDEVLWQGDDTVHCTDGACDDRPYVTYLDVRPGSRPDDLVVVYGWSRCGAPSWGSATLVDGALVRGGGGVPSGASCATDAAFSPEGDALAVLDSDGAAWRLHLQRWSDDGPTAEVAEDEGPGTGDAPGIAELPGLVGWTEVRIADWTRTSTSPDGGGTEEILLVARSDEGLRALTVAVERSADGALAVAGEAVPLDGTGGTVVAGAGPYRVVVEAAADGTSAAPRLVADGLPDLALPAEVVTAGRSAWLAAGDDGTVVVGDGRSRAWTVQAGTDGWSPPVELPAPVTAGDVLAPDVPVPADLPTPAPPAASGG